MNFLKRINVNVIAILLLSSWYLIPIISTKLGAVGFVVLLLFWSASTNYNILYHSLKSLGFFLVWYFLLILTILFGLYDGTQNILYYLLMSFGFAIPMLFWEYYNNLQNNKNISLLAKAIIIYSLISSIMTIIVLVTYPEASKKLAMGDNYLIDLQFYYDLGCGGFGNIYGFVIMFIPLMLYHTEHKKWQLLKNVTLVLGIVSVLMSLYTIALLLILISLSIYILFTIYKRNITVGIILTFVIMIGLTFLNNIFEFISNLLSNIGFDETALRINEIIDALSGNSLGYNLDARINKYSKSIILFLNHPILGNQVFNGGQYGGHSSVFDEIAKYGLIMYSFRIMFIKKSYEQQIKYCNSTLLVPYIVYIVLAILNPTIYIYQIGFCLFFVSSILLQKRDNENTGH